MINWPHYKQIDLIKECSENKIKISEKGTESWGIWIEFLLVKLVKLGNCLNGKSIHTVRTQDF